MILGLHHAALSVPDLERALEFYSGRLGFEPVMRAEIPPRVEAMARAFGIDDSGCRVAMLKKGNSCIELFEFQAEDTPAGDPQRPVNQHGITHICLAVDDYASDYEELEEAGVQFNGPPMGAAPNRWAYGRDPFGNVIELLEHAPDSPSALDFG